MAVGRPDYKAILTALLPPGTALAGRRDSVLQRLLGGLSKELERVDSRSRAMLDEADPRRTRELFGEWESSFGLPDDCTPDEQAMTERRQALLGRIVSRGGMRPQDYKDLAAGLGYDGVEIIEYREAVIGWYDGPGHAGAEIGDALNGEEWNHAWDALIPEGVVRQSVVSEAEIGDALRSWGDDLIECVLHKAGPSWGYLNVAYIEED